MCDAYLREMGRRFVRTPEQLAEFEAEKRKAMDDYLADAIAVRTRTLELRAKRLAKENAEKSWDKAGDPG
jgi:hypothetical protein